MYVYYDYYVNNGGTITDKTTFQKYYRKVIGYLNDITTGNINKFNEQNIPDELKLLIVDLIDENFNSDNRSSSFGGGNVTSMSNSGVSVTLSSSTADDLKNTVHNVTYGALANIYTPDGLHILYRGL